ncbi:MAG: repressor LexA [Chloroflexi bacterium]|nr:MAG: repressor LexA [Chloroflexota bacterium]
MNSELPTRQRQVLKFLEEYLETNEYPPTLREIGRAIDVKSTSLISYYLDQLEKQGRLVRQRSVSRGLRLVNREPPREPKARPEIISIPYLGHIVAGAPVPIEPLSGDESVELSRALFGANTANLFALTVKGDSMIDALIHNGDMVVLRHQERVENGEMAAVWLDEPGETTLKKVYYEGQQVRLQPANPSMGPIYVPADNVRVQGKVVMVIRQLE